MPKMIDLGKSYDSSEIKKDVKKVSYPSLYISGIEGLNLPTGEFTFTCKGEVVSINKKSNSCEIEIHQMSSPSGGSKSKSDSGDALDSALSKISKKKQETPDEESAEEEAGMDNGEEESEEE